VRHGASGWDADDPASWDVDKLRGVDRYADAWAWAVDLPVERIAPSRALGARAARVRDVQLLARAEAPMMVLYFSWEPSSRFEAIVRRVWTGAFRLPAEAGLGARGCVRLYGDVQVIPRACDRIDLT